jgi:hypothetical protein
MTWARTPERCQHCRGFVRSHTTKVLGGFNVWRKCDRCGWSTYSRDRLEEWTAFVAENGIDAAIARESRRQKDAAKATYESAAEKAEREHAARVARAQSWPEIDLGDVTSPIWSGRNVWRLDDEDVFEWGLTFSVHRIPSDDRSYGMMISDYEITTSYWPLLDGAYVINLVDGDVLSGHFVLGKWFYSWLADRCGGRSTPVRGVPGPGELDSLANEEIKSLNDEVPRSLQPPTVVIKNVTELMAYAAHLNAMFQRRRRRQGRAQ